MHRSRLSTFVIYIQRVSHESRVHLDIGTDDVDAELDQLPSSNTWE